MVSTATARRLICALALAMAGSPWSARAEQGALTVELGGALRLGAVSPSVGVGPNVIGTLGGPWLGVRYAFTHRLEVEASAFWEARATYVHESIAVATGSGTISGALTQDVSRWGGAAGLRYALLGMVWRVPIGFDVGWAHVSTTRRDLVDVSNPRAPTSFGLHLGDGSSDHLLLAPFVGLEWLASDHLSLSVVPRLELLVGTGSTLGVVVPLTIGWSWYLL